MKRRIIRLITVCSAAAAISAAFAITASAATALPTSGGELKGGVTYALAADISGLENPYVVSSGNVTVNLNKHTISRSGVVFQVNGGTLTIKESGSGRISSDQGGVIQVNNAALVIDAGTSTVLYATGNAAAIDAKDSTITIDNGRILSMEGIGINADNTEITIKSTSTSDTKKGVSGTPYGIAAHNGSKVTLNENGYVVTRGSSGAAIYVEDSEIELNETGKIDGDSLGIAAANGSIVTINGGNIYGSTAISSDVDGDNTPSKIIVNGGLLGGVSTSKGIVADNDIVIVDGGTIQATNGITLTGANANLTVNDGTIKNRVSTDNSIGITAYGGTAVINGGTITARSAGYRNYCDTGNRSTLIVNGGVIQQTGGEVIVGTEGNGHIQTPNAAITSEHGGLDLTINGGTIECTAAEHYNNTVPASIVIREALSVRGGDTFEGPALPSTVVINGGSFPDEVYIEDNTTKNVSTLTINGGTFGSDIKRIDIGEVEVISGTFAENTDDLLNMTAESSVIATSGDNYQVSKISDLGAATGTFKTAVKNGVYDQVTVDSAHVSSENDTVYKVNDKRYVFDFSAYGTVINGECILNLVITDIPSTETVTVELQ